MLYGMLKEYRALITFDSLSEAFGAEQVLKERNCPSALIHTPRSLRAGCNRALCFPLAFKDLIEDLIDARVVFTGCYEARKEGFVPLGEEAGDSESNQGEDNDDLSG